jgi:TonB family protein
MTLPPRLRLATALVLPLLALPPARSSTLGAQDDAAPEISELEKNVPPVRIPPAVVSQVAPEYPAEMRRSGIKGAVLVEFVVDVHGGVQNPVVVNSNGPEFEDPAIEAVSRWKFKAATVGGRPVNTHLRVPIVFQMPGQADYGEDSYKIEKKSGSARSPTPRTIRVPVYPYELRRDGVTGHAKAIVTVDETGRVVKIALSESSRPEFASALIAALEGFAFNPAIKGGKPVPAAVIYSQTFDDSDLEDPAAGDLLDLEKKRPQSIHNLGDLDAFPRPVSRRPPIFPNALAGTVTSGSATVLFLIDSDGHARLPRVVEASDPAFGYAAVEAVSSWIFDPPTFHGHAVVARAEIPILFKFESPDK